MSDAAGGKSSCSDRHQPFSALRHASLWRSQTLLQRSTASAFPCTGNLSPEPTRFVGALLIVAETTHNTGGLGSSITSSYSVSALLQARHRAFSPLGTPWLCLHPTPVLMRKDLTQQRLFFLCKISQSCPRSPCVPSGSNHRGGKQLLTVYFSDSFSGCLHCSAGHCLYVPLLERHLVLPKNHNPALLAAAQTGTYGRKRGLVLAG